MPLPGSCGHARYKTELLDQLAAKKAARSCGFKVKEDFMSWAPRLANMAVKWHLFDLILKPRRYGDFPQQSASIAAERGAVLKRIVKKYGQMGMGLNCPARHPIIVTS